MSLEVGKIVMSDRVCMLVMLIVMVAMLLNHGVKKTSHLLALACCITTVGLLGDSVARQLNELPVTSEFLVYLCNFLSLIAGPLSTIPLILYFKHLIYQKTYVSPWVFRIPIFVDALLTINIAVLIITNQLFYVQNGLVVSVGDLPPYTLFVSMFCMAYCPLVALSKVKDIGIRTTIILMTYGLIPFSALCIGLFSSKASYTLTFFAISLLLLYCFLQNSDAGEKVEKITRLNTLLENRLSIIQSMGKVYFSSYYIDLVNDTFEEINSKTNIREKIGLYGHAQEALYNMCDTLIQPEFADKIREFVDLSTIDERLKENNFITCEYIGVTSGWSQMYFIAGERDEKGKLLTVFSATRTIHDEKAQELAYQNELQEALDEARRANASKTAFLSQMSHDIRTPLNGIIGILEINEKHADDRELVDQNRGKAKVAANHLLSLISDVLQISKLEDKSIPLAHEAFNIAELADDIFSIVEIKALEDGITIVRQDKTGPIYPYVYGSPLHFRLIMINIFSNAIKYNREKGYVYCSGETLHYDDKRAVYRFIIRDTGIGMSEEFMEHMFEPFSQEHTDARSTYNGTGLGMAIVKNLVDRMDGTIEVYSKVGEGSTFILTIPFEAATEADVKNEELETVDSIEGVKVLLVEDNELNMEIAETILTDIGLVVSKAYNGKEAVEVFAENEPGSFDIILMDLMMPELDGFEATQAIRQLERADAKTIPIVAMTANAFIEDAQKCYAAGMDAHLSKPIMLEELMRIVSKLVNGEK